MHKYKMLSNLDYRLGIFDEESHGVMLIKRIDGEDWAYGQFSIVDEDMILCTEEEEQIVDNSLKV